MTQGCTAGIQRCPFCDADLSEKATPVHIAQECPDAPRRVIS